MGLVAWTSNEFGGETGEVYLPLSAETAGSAGNGGHRLTILPGRPATVYDTGTFEIEFTCGEGHSGGALFDESWRWPSSLRAVESIRKPPSA